MDNPHSGRMGTTGRRWSRRMQIDQVELDRMGDVII